MYVKTLILFALAVIAVILALAIAVRYRGIGKPRTRWLTKAPFTARVTEALVLLLTSGVIWFLVAGSRGATGGDLLHLSTVPSPFVPWQVLAAGIAGVLVLAGVFLAWRGWTRYGVAVAVIALLLYCGALHVSARDTREWLKAQSEAPVDTLFVFELEDGLPGADLWLNDVYMGTMPVTIRASELRAKVPEWPQREGDKKPDLPAPVASARQPGDTGETPRPDWMSCSLHFYPGDAPKAWRTYYARIRLNGEWPRGGWGCSGGGGPELQTKTFNLSFASIERRARLLMDQARLANFRVGPAWFEAMDSYGMRGWNAVRDAADSEAGFNCVLDDWARHRYQLDAVKDTDSAWRVFERICSEADSRGAYSTEHIEGRAVELLSPFLPQDRIVERAERRIQRINPYWYGYPTWHKGPFALEVGERETAILSPSRDDTSKERTFMPSDGALAHTAWLVHQRLLAAHPDEPTLIQTHLAAAIIRARCSDDSALRLTAVLGGPVTDHYFLGRRPATGYTAHIEGEQVERWFYLSLFLNDVAGRAFRTAHRRDMLALGERIADRVASMGNISALEFLFMDNDLCPQSPAAEFRPTFEKSVLAKPRGADNLDRLWKYLVRMEPASTVDDYVSAWRSALQASDRPDLEPLRDLPRGKRIAVLEALLKYLSQNGPLNENSGVPGDIRTELARAGAGEAQARWVLDRLEKREGGPLDYWLQGWRDGRTHNDALIALLSKSANPAFRVEACRGIEVHPTKANREILAKLLADASPDVRTAAEATAKSLADLAATPPGKLALIPR